MENENDLSSTVVAKSDQLNADELIDPITITITRVDKVAAKDQPVHIHSDGIQPYKPCLTMRRMLIAAWGKYKDAWVGRSMVLYCDPEVMWAGKEQGGVRVSHVSDIDQPVSRMLAVTRGRKKLFTLLPLVATRQITADDQKWIDAVIADPEVLNQINDPEYKAFIESKLQETAP